MQLKSVGKGGRRLLKSLLERSKLCYLKAGWDRSGANMLATGLEKATDTWDFFLLQKYMSTQHILPSKAEFSTEKQCS